MNIFEFEELALYLCGVEIWEMSDPPEIDIDGALYEKFNVDFAQFASIAEALLPLAVLAGPNTGSIAQEVRQGFGVSGAFLVKKTVDDPDLIALACFGGPRAPAQKPLHDTRIDSGDEG